MAKKVSTRTSVEGMNDSLTSLEQRLEKNKKIIYYVAGAIVAVIAVAVIYIYGFREPGIADAQAMVNKADVKMLQGDTTAALDLYQKAYKASSYAPANRAGQMAAQILYAKGKTDDALKILEECDYNGKIVGPAYKSLLGDCYVNKKNWDKAIAAYDDAISMAGDNDNYTPVFMLKKAEVLENNKKYDDAAAVYQAIKDKYPIYGGNVGIDRFIERAKAEAGK